MKLASAPIEYAIGQRIYDKNARPETLPSYSEIVHKAQSKFPSFSQNTNRHGWVDSLMDVVRRLQISSQLLLARTLVSILARAKISFRLTVITE